jgi:hypothetical protein
MNRPRLVVEADNDSWKRKWESTLAIHADYYPHVVYVTTCPSGKTASIVAEKNMLPQTVPPKFYYYRIKSGFYFHLQKWILITKKIEKTFTVGLHPNSHMIYQFNPESDLFTHPNFMSLAGADLINPPRINLEGALNTHGAISPRLFLSKSKIYYLNMPIGIRTGRSLVLASPEYEPEVSQILRDHRCEILA